MSSELMVSGFLFEQIMRELNEAQYDETLTLEVFSKDREYLKISKDKIKRMWEAL